MLRRPKHSKIEVVASKEEEEEEEEEEGCPTYEAEKPLLTTLETNRQ